ncbi:hypothetical protein CQW23_01667 [Capsicum baccatum]|uniref:Uncharacterized protein n=1 Tax=Capsicum baccatum TaxID=33114 RepID=A0A2G2XP90_CAPBA|nr:hypothetical protein CQW23_01667 [Capsicum baccatum]
MEGSLRNFTWGSISGSLMGKYLITLATSLLVLFILVMMWALVLLSSQRLILSDSLPFRLWLVCYYGLCYLRLIIYGIVESIKLWLSEHWVFMITHGNIVATSVSVRIVILKLGSDDVHFAYRPFAHVFELASETAMLTAGACIGYGSALTMDGHF